MRKKSAHCVVRADSPARERVPVARSAEAETFFPLTEATFGTILESADNSMRTSAVWPSDSSVGLLEKGRAVDREAELVPKWRNWQTRCVQGAVSLGSCGFESHLRHFSFSRSFPKTGWGDGATY